MSITADASKHGKTVVATAKASAPTVAETRTPFYASVGVIDLAVQRARALPSTVPAQLTNLQEQAKTLPGTLPAQVQAQVKALPTAVLTLPSTVKTLQGKSIGFYGELAARGEKVVSAIRKQPSTEVVAKAAKATVRNAKATAKSATRTAKATEQAVEEAAEKLG